MTNKAKIEISATDKTKGAFRSINNSLKSTISGLGGMATAISAAVGIGGLGLLIKNSLSAGDALAKTADKLAITTQALAGLRHAAELGGVANSALDNSLQRLTRGLAEVATTGGGTAKKALDALGLSARDLLQLPLEQQMGIVADALVGVKSQAERVKIAFDLFGREGVDMVNVLAGGSAGLRDAAAEAIAFGSAISRVDAAKIEAANDAFSRVKAAIAGVGLKITAELAPYLKAVADYFSNMAAKSGGWGGVIVNAIESIVTGFGYLGNIIQGVKFAIAGMKLVFAKVAEYFLKAINHIAQKFAALASIIPGMSETAAAFGNTFAFAVDNAAERSANFKMELDAIAAEGLPGDTIAAEFNKIRDAANENAILLADDKLLQQQSELAGMAKHIDNVVSLDQARTEKLKNNRKKELTDLEKFNAKSWDGQVGQVAGALEAMTRGVSQNSKKMFQINKIAGIANAIINTSEGVTKALASYPPPLSFAMAAAQLAAGLVQVNAIKSTTFGSGGSAPSVAGSGSGSVAPVPTIDSAAPSEGITGTASTAPTITINFEGEGRYSKDEVRDLIEQINVELGDGAYLAAA